MSSDQQSLSDLRQAIDRIDRELVALLAERVRCLDQVIAVKLRDNLPAAIPARVEQVIAHVRKEAEEAGLSPDLAERVWRGLIDWSIAYEEQQMGESTPKALLKTVK